MQRHAPEATDIRSESEAIKEMYGLNDKTTSPFGRQCLMARRLVERGVRFVQIYHNNWDTHTNVTGRLPMQCKDVDQACYGLVQDLKQRGLLDSTLIICTSEFGRQPFMQGSQKGRDHNPGVFTAWLAGGGIRGGTSYGTSDDLGWQAAEHPCYSYDLHATELHLLGLDHERLSFYHNGIARRLTDVHGHVIREILA